MSMKNNNLTQYMSVKVYKNLSRNDLMTLIFGVVSFVAILIFILITGFFPTKDTQESGMYKLFGFFNDFFYFTTQSNLFISLALIAYSVKKNNKTNNFLAFGIIYITITFVVYWILLAWQSNWSTFYNAFRSFMVHFIVPMLAYISLYFYRKEVVFTKKTLWTSPLYLFGYSLFTLILYYSTLNNEYYYTYDTKTKAIKYFAVVVYGFANYQKPLYIAGAANNLGLRVFLIVIIFIIFVLLPLGFGYAFVKLFKLKYESNFKFLKKFKI
ncbi:predicted coding region [Mycoplasmopsis pulmonis]|uniref:DUF1600 domain-containing protein n=3 Tax=Mycoplasmopsis pulmonis TaxID=2107 RepID=Q98QD1_MYCPU|nr:predicted coding region [Mycoplasmopsis pulmonis]